MRDTLIDILMIALLAGAFVTAVVHVIGLFGEPSEIIGTTIYETIN